MYGAITSSVTFPLLQQKYPRAHRCLPQDAFRRCEYSFSSVCGGDWNVVSREKVVPAA
jgi:hypothetical protein